MVELHRQNYSENKKLYTRIENALKEKLGYSTPINHVGSTAIKNMWGKNIIDVLVGASSENEMEEFSKIITDLGFFLGNHSTGMIYRFFVNILAYDKKITYISIRHKIEYIRSHDKIKLM